MTSIIVSADVADIAHAVSEKTAHALGYALVDTELLSKIAAEHHLKKKRLDCVLDPASYAKLSKKERNLYLAHVQSAVFKTLAQGNVVCTGLAAHLYVREISHIMLVHVLSSSPTDVRGRLAVKTRVLERADKQRQRLHAQRTKWSMECFSVDENEPSIYDMVITLGQIEEAKLVDIIRDMVGYRKFQPMSYSRKCLADLALAAKVKTILLPKYPDIGVRANGETVIVHVRCSLRRKQDVATSIKHTVGELPDVNFVEVHTTGKLT